MKFWKIIDMLGVTNDIGKIGLTMFLVMGVYTSPTFAPSNPEWGFMMIWVVMMCLLFINFGLLFKRTKTPSHAEILEVMRTFVVGVIISLVWAIFFGLVFDTGAFHSLEIFLTSTSLVAFIVGLGTSAVWDIAQRPR